jgi:DNA-binding Lrp family transcriptional regulator
MTQKPLTSAFILIDTGSFAPQGHMAADVHAVRAKLLEAGGEAVDFVHCLTGPNDLLMHLHAGTPEAMLEVLDQNIRELKGDQHNYVTRTETILVTASHGAKLNRAKHGAPKGAAAWVFANVNTPDPDIAANLLKLDPRVVHVATVVGQYDVLIYLEADDLAALREALDVTLRKKNYFATTDTRLVLM